jgi:hypothetical protein
LAHTALPQQLPIHWKLMQTALMLEALIHTAALTQQTQRNDP